jgi:hypothetical protein
MMSIGWALRGSIGGGPLGAMIPGALFAMAVAHQRKWTAREAALFVGLSAVGIGLGGQMTYGQTIGLLREVDTRWWGLTGLTVKGAIWGLLGGAVMALAWRMPKRPVVVALLLIGATQAGWVWVNEPKLIYFSHPTVKPRPEIWAGLLFSALAVMAYVRDRVVTRLALFGMVGGAIGFGGGSFFNLVPVAGFPGWKMMEFTFGLVLGAVMWFAVPEEKPIEARAFEPKDAAWYPLWTGVVVWGDLHAPGRFPYTLVTAVVLVLLPRFAESGWMLGWGATLAAACVELHETHVAWAWVLAIVPVGVVVWWQMKREQLARDAMWWLLAVCCWIYCLEYFFK